MKKLFILVATMALCLPAIAGTDMCVKLKDGEIVKYDVNSVEEVFYLPSDDVVDTSRSLLKFEITSDSTVKIIKADAYKNYETFSIPQKVTIDGREYEVTGIGDSTFAGCDKLKEIEYPSSITNIGNNAFSNCKEMKTFEIFSNVTNIGEHAFEGCDNLSEIEIPSNVTDIRESAFEGCTNLDVTIDNSIDDVKVGKDAFKDCKSVKYKKASDAVDISETPLKFKATSDNTAEVISDESYKSLDSVNIPSKVRIDGNVYIVRGIGSGAFSECTELESVTLPASINYIDASAFNNCHKLTNIELPEGVTTIESRAFQGCFSLTKIELPASLTMLSTSAFDYCKNLTSISVSSDNQEYTSANDLLYNKDKTALVTVPKGIKGSVTVPSGVTTIGENAFRTCEGIANVELPMGVKNIGECAFFGCNGLTSINIPSTTTSIDERAFMKCISLTKIGIPSSVTLIESFAFAECEKLDVTINNSAKNVKYYNSTFDNCKSMTFMAIDESETALKFDIVDSVAIVKGDGSYRQIDSVSIPSFVMIAGKMYSVAGIGEMAFLNCNNLKKIKLASGVTFIGNSAFERCGLTEIEIPDGVTIIESGAFYECIYLTRVELPASLTKIGNEAFSGCYNIEDLKLPNGITKIETSAFRFCSGLTNVKIPSTTTEIGEYAFSNCPYLNVTIDNSEGNIVVGKNTFNDCVSVKYLK